MGSEEGEQGEEQKKKKKGHLAVTGCEMQREREIKLVSKCKIHVLLIR